MPVYAWKGLNTAGKASSGTRDADSPKLLRQALRKDGIFVTEHKEVLGAGAKAAGLAPDLAATVQRKLGGQRIAEEHVSAQTTKR